MRAAGVEPALCRQNWILSPARLPVPPRPHVAASSSHCSCRATLLRLSTAPICHNKEQRVQQNPADGQGKILHRWARNSPPKVLLTHAFRRRRYGRDAARISPPGVHLFRPEDCLYCTARTRRTPAMFSIRRCMNDAVAGQFRIGKDANVRIRGFRPLLRAFRASAIARPRAPVVGRDRNATARSFAQVQVVPPPPRTCARSSRHRGQTPSSARQMLNRIACPRGPRASMTEHA